MRRSFAPWFILIACLASGGPVPAQDFTKFEFQAQPLAGNVTLLRGAGGNLAVCAGPDGLLVVDSDYEPMSEKLRAALASLGGPARFVVNTHWHFDHVGGNASLAADGAVIVAAESLCPRLAAGQRIAILDEDIPPAPAAALPRLTFTDSVIFHLNGEEIVVLHPAAAHTDGDAIVHFRRANVLHAGDIVFFCGYPFVDVSSGGNIDGVIAAVGAIIARCDEATQVVPGHGPVTDRSGLGGYLAMLTEFRAAIAAQMAAGRGLAEIKASNATAALDEKYGGVYFPPALFAEMVYRSLRPE